MKSGAITSLFENVKEPRIGDAPMTKECYQSSGYTEPDFRKRLFRLVEVRIDAEWVFLCGVKKENAAILVRVLIGFTGFNGRTHSKYTLPYIMDKLQVLNKPLLKKHDLEAVKSHGTWWRFPRSEMDGVDVAKRYKLLKKEFAGK